MALVDETQQRNIAQAIADVETKTNAELVTVLAAASDDYRYVPLLWAALGALTVPSVLYFTGLGTAWLLGAQLGVLVVAGWVLQADSLRVRLIPKNVRAWRASNMARRQFLEQGLHHTEGDTGVLIFVSEAEHYVEILADRGISERVDDSRWETIVETFVNAVRAGRVEAGFIDAINQVGEILAEAVPKTPDNKNELDNRLILIGYD
jgi:putative membrane protein